MRETVEPITRYEYKLDRAYDDTPEAIFPIASPAAQLNTLPYDVLLTISSHVPSLRDLSHLSLVCRALAQPAQYALFQHLPPLSPRHTVLAFRAVLRKPHLARAVKSVKLIVCEADELQDAETFGLQPAAWLRLVWRAIRCMPGLRDLELVAEQRKDRDPSLPRIWEEDNLVASNLKLKRANLRLPAPDPVAFLAQQTALKELVLKMHYGVVETGSVGALSRLTPGDLRALRSLDAGSSALERLLPGRPVERLTIDDWLMPIGTPGMGHVLLPAADYLKALSMRYLFMKPAVIQWVAEHITGLEELSFSVLSQSGDPLTDQLKHPGVLQSIRRLKKLKKFRFELVHEFPWRGQAPCGHVALLGKACEALEEVEVNIGPQSPYHYRRSKAEGSEEWGDWVLRSYTIRELRGFALSCQ